MMHDFSELTEDLTSLDLQARVDFWLLEVCCSQHRLDNFDQAFSNLRLFVSKSGTDL